MDFRKNELKLLNEEIMTLESEYEVKLKRSNILSKFLKIFSGLCGTTNIICGVIVTALLNANVAKTNLLPLSIIVSIMSVITTTISSQDSKMIKTTLMYLDILTSIKNSKLEINSMLSRSLSDDLIDEEEYDAITEKYKDINSVILSKKSEIIAAHDNVC